MTYTNALRNLEEKGLLIYTPSQSKYKCSQIELLILTEKVLEHLVASMSATMCRSEQGAAHSSAHGAAQGSAQGDEQGAAALYKTVQTYKHNKQINEGNSAISPSEIFSDNFSLLEEEKGIISDKVVKWCNFVRTSVLALPELLKTKKEIQAQSKGAIELYENLRNENLSFDENLKVVNERFTLYAHFLKSKPNDAFLREMFTPQGITAKNVFQQFEQGASDVQAQKVQVVHFPEKWNEQFYCDLLKNKQAATAKRYEAKLKEELGLEVYFSKKASKWGVRKCELAQV